jgi:hypothetical protein
MIKLICSKCDSSWRCDFCHCLFYVSPENADHQPDHWNLYLCINISLYSYYTYYVKNINCYTISVCDYEVMLTNLHVILKLNLLLLNNHLFMSVIGSPVLNVC